MDRLESLTNAVSQITLYDIKSMYNQGSKFDINARYSARALQLLEYIIKHGSERVVDDARSHISTIKMLRNFHYIDEKGKDEGINENTHGTTKGQANKHKYTGTGNDGFGSGGMSFSSGSSRYGGFGSETMGYGGSGDHGETIAPSRVFEALMVLLDYGSYGGSSSSGGFRDDTRRGESTRLNVCTDPTRLSTASSVTAKAKAPAPAAVQEVDLLGGFGDDDAFATPAPGFSVDKALPAVAPPVAQAAPVSLDDDDFADFQAAPVSPTAAAMNSAPAITAKPNLMQMLGQTATRPAVTPAQPTIPMQPAFSGMGMGMGGMTTGHRQNLSGSFSPAAQTTAPNYFGGAPIKPSTTPAMTPIAMNPSRPGVTSAAMTPTSTTSSKGGANFDDLWSMSLGSSAKPATNTASQSKSIKDLEKEKATAGLWGAGGKPLAMGGSSAFGNFGSATGGGSGAANNGDDDLLL
ncbi:Epsin, clathrin recruitment and traffic [Salix suchowensis]|nr:Epsin, clathrin recruitment and traffic [Salix suchowensis]